MDVPAGNASGAGAGGSGAIEQRLDTLLMVEGILGVALFDPAGRVQATVNLRANDAAVLFNALSTAIGGPTRAPGQEPAFAAFTLSRGQIAIGSDAARALIALTDLGLDARVLRTLLSGYLEDFAAAPSGDGAG